MSNKWIQKALNPAKKGILRKELGVSKKTGNISKEKLNLATKKKGIIGKRARLAKTLSSFH